MARTQTSTGRIVGGESDSAIAYSPSAMHRRLAPAFSLAELMIALVILGLGLLFIAAALPTGVNYARITSEKATGEAAARHALDQIEWAVRTSTNYWRGNPTVPAERARIDSFVRPRDVTAGAPLTALSNPPFAPAIEPLLKVRPLIMGNVDYSFGAAVGANPNVVDVGEEALARLIFGPAGLINTVQATTFGNPDQTIWSNFEPVGGALGTIPQFDSGLLRLTFNPVLPATARVYPPMGTDNGRTVENFLVDSGGYGPYVSDPLTASEARRLRDRRFVWTALYRRVKYSRLEPGPTAAGEPSFGDPQLYEVIVVVCRRPSEQYRFPVQDVDFGSIFDVLTTPRAVTDPDLTAPIPLSAATVAPQPWLVSFVQAAGEGAKSLVSPALTAASSPPNPNTPHSSYRAPGGVVIGATNFDQERELWLGFQQRPTLTFTIRTPPAGQPGLDGLLPVGSIIIPARNDEDLNQTLIDKQRYYGFVPHAPDALPIYEVIERPDPNTVVVKGNGLYPWVSGLSIATVEGWVCWIIPPPYAQRQPNRQPIYEKTSHIVTVARRFIRVPNVE